MADYRISIKIAHRQAKPHRTGLVNLSRRQLFKAPPKRIITLVPTLPEGPDDVDLAANMLLSLKLAYDAKKRFAVKKQDLLIALVRHRVQSEPQKCCMIDWHTMQDCTQPRLNGAYLCLKHQLQSIEAKRLLMDKVN